MPGTAPRVSELAQLSSAEPVAQVREAHGLTWGELGAAMSRSERMMRKVARGRPRGRLTGPC